MANKPWEEEGVPFKTEAAFWAWVKGVLRKGWSRHPIKVQYIQSLRYKAPLGKKTKRNLEGLVWAVDCECCGKPTPQNKTQCDHIHASKQERWYDDIDAFVHRMYYVTFEDIQALCIPCHEIKTEADKQDCSFEEARDIYKPLIAFKNKKAKDQVDTLKSLGIIPGKNKEARVLQYKEVLRRG